MDMRYWSMCIAEGLTQLPTVVNPLPSGETDYGCRADDATARNAAGDYMFVIGTESQRDAIDSVPGATFLPFATDQTTPLYVLLLRETLVNPAFPHSTANVTQTGDPAAAEAAMGPYYPRISVCPLTAPSPPTAARPDRAVLGVRVSAARRRCPGAAAPGGFGRAPAVARGPSSGGRGSRCPAATG